MKKISQVTALFFILLLSCLPSFAEEHSLPEISSKHYILINPANSQVLLKGKHAEEKTSPSSAIKLLTAIVVLEHLSLSDRVEITKEALSYTGAHIALVPDEILTVEDLLHAVIIDRANDAANALALKVSGTYESFRQLLVQKAEEIGLSHTSIRNHTGTADTEQYTTVSDLAKIAVEAYHNSTLREILSAKRYIIPENEIKKEKRYLNSTFSLFEGMIGSLDKINVDGVDVQTRYDYANGMITGKSDDGTGLIIASASHENRNFIAVVAHSGNMYQDAVRLLNYGFRHTYSYDIPFSGKEVQIGNRTVQLVLKNTARIDLPYPSDFSENVETTLEEKVESNVEEGVKTNVEETQSGEEKEKAREVPLEMEAVMNKKISFPIEEYSVLGTLYVNDTQGNPIAELPLYSDTPIDSMPLLDDSIETFEKKWDIDVLALTVKTVLFFSILRGLYSIDSRFKKTYRNKEKTTSNPSNRSR